MKKLLPKLMMYVSLCLSVNMAAQTAGTLTFTFTEVAKTPTYNGNFQHVLAAWVQTNSGAFVKTKLRYAGSGTSDHLPTWAANAGCASSANCLGGACNIVDGTTGATRSSWTGYTITWDGCIGAAGTGTLQPDAVYKVTIQSTWNHGTTGTATSSYTFTKGPSADHQTPAANSYFTGVKLDWVPTVATPAANLTSSVTKCVNSPITFTDASSNAPTGWSWTFPGGTPSTATTSVVSISYSTPGTYSVTHTANNASGTSTPITQTFVVNALPAVAASNATVCSGTPANLTATGATTYNWSTGATGSVISVTPTATTIYTVTGTNASGCANTKTLSVTVNSAPVLAVNNATICSGSSTVLSASGAASYSWSTGASTSSVAVAPSATTIYTVTGANALCSATNTVDVTVVATPTISVNSATICSGSSATVIASGATTYNWNTGATTATISVSPTSTTNYTVTGASWTCTNTKTLSVTVKPSPVVSVNSTTVCAGITSSLTASGATTYSWSTGATSASISVTPASTSVYTVTGTTSGCTNIKTTTVTVNPAPVISVNSATICSGATATLTANGAVTYAWNTGSTSSNITASPTSNTTYTVSGTSSAGCTSTSTTSIIVSTAPPVTVNAASICTGSSATLTATGASSYTWSTGSNSTSIIVIPLSTTVYTVSGYLAGCASTTVKTTTVLVNALPIVNLPSVNALCVGDQPVTLSGTPTGGIYTGPGVTGSSFDPTVSSAGTFTVSYAYTDINGCSASDSKTITVNLCTGIFETNTFSTAIFPNPTNDVISISGNELLINSVIQIYDGIGALVMTEKMSTSSATLSLSHLAKGMYTLIIISNNKQSILKVIKD